MRNDTSIKESATDRCQFSELLYFWQLDANLLSDDETAALLQHLDEDPSCEACFSQMRRNAAVLNAVQVADEVAERHQGPVGSDGGITLPLAAAGYAPVCARSSEPQQFDEFRISDVRCEVLTDADGEGLVYLRVDPARAYQWLCLDSRRFRLSHQTTGAYLVSDLGIAEIEEVLEAWRLNSSSHVVQLLPVS